MQYKFTDRLKHAWNVFKSRDPTDYMRKDWYGLSDSEYRPGYSRGYFGAASDKSIVTAIKNRIAVDAAQVDIQHVRLDDNNRFLEVVPSGLNRCLSVEANIDQTGRAFRLDIFMSLLDEGVIALVPIDTDLSPYETGGYDILNMRVGKITQWKAKSVQVSVYNENTGKREERIVPKKTVAIVENPFYAVMNEPNSTFQRLIHKLALLDSVDEQASQGKLDLIIQLPYVVKGETRRQQALNRRKEIEEQLNGSKYGIAWTDGTERIQQLNRPLENNLLGQIQYLTDLAFTQSGTTPEVLNGTADEKTMLNYNNRVIEPLVASVADAIKRSFLTRTAITQKQSIEYFRDPFSLVPVNNIADIADKFTRNEILTSNEIRQIIGIKPSKDPNADMLRNKNLYDTTGMGYDSTTGQPESVVGPDNQNGEEEQTYESMTADLDSLDSQLDDLEAALEQSDTDEDGLDYLFHNYDPEYRHQYYLKYEKQNRTVGDKNSTAGLNEEGRAYAAYLRETLGNERKAKVASSKSAADAGVAESKKKTDAGIAESRSRMQSGIETSKARRDTTVSAANEARDRQIEKERGGMESDIESSKNQRDNTIASINSERDRTIEAERERTKSEIESHKNATQARIEVLRNTLSSMSKEDKAAYKETIRAEIDKLRNENSQKRADLQEAFKETSNEARSEAKSKSNEARESHKKSAESSRSKFKETSSSIRTETKKDTDKVKEEHKAETAKLREGHKAESDKLRQEHKDMTAILREAHKANTAQAKAEYDEEYARNLEYIKSLPEYQAAKKKNGGGSGIKASKSSDGRYYVKK